MNHLKAASLLCALPAVAFAVYAPIPDQEQADAVNVALEVGLGWDDNVLGSSANALDSNFVYFNPSVDYDASLSDQTLFTARYALGATYYADRPSEKYLFNHGLELGLIHTFSPTLFARGRVAVDLVDSPEAIEPGLAGQIDQSYRRILAEASLSGSTSEIFSGTLRTRYVDIAYDEEGLNYLDRTEIMIGAEGLYKLNEEYSVVGELKYRVTEYDDSTSLADSDIFIYAVGINYAMSETLDATFRVGGESRDREGAVAGGNDDQGFYLSATLVHRYADLSFLSAGATFQTNETDDLFRFVDQEVFSIFGNIQHAFTEQVIGSTSLTYTNADNQARPGFTNVEDVIVRWGLGVTYLPTENWSFIFRYDLDNVTSDRLEREQERSRITLSARYTFGAGGN